MRHVRLTWDGLFVGRSGITLPGLVVVVAAAIVVAITVDWWKGLLMLALIPLTLCCSWAEVRMGFHRCPTCGGSGRVTVSQNPKGETQQ